MAMQWQQAPIQFNSGINQKTDDKQVVPGQWLVLENLEMQKTGRFKKRRGFTLSESFTSAVTLAENNKAAQTFPRETESTLRADAFVDLGVKANQDKFSRATYGFNGTSGALTYSIDNDAGTSGQVRTRYTDAAHNVVTDALLDIVDLTAPRASSWVGVSGTGDACGTVLAAFTTGSGVNATISFASVNGITYAIASNVDFSFLSAYAVGNYVFVVYCDKTAGNTKVIRLNIGVGVDYQTTIASSNKATAVSSNGSFVFVVCDKTLYRFSMTLTGVTTIRTASAAGAVVQIATEGSFIIDDGTNCTVSPSFGSEFTHYNLQTTNVSPFTFGSTVYAVFMPRKPADLANWYGGHLLKRIVAYSLPAVAYEETVAGGFLYDYMATSQGLSQPYQGNLPLNTVDSMILARFAVGTSCYADVIDRDAVFSTTGLRLSSAKTDSVSLASSGTYGWHIVPAISSIAVGSGTTTLPAGEYQVCAIFEMITTGGSLMRSSLSNIYRYTHTLNKDFTVTIKCPTAEKIKVYQGSVSIYIKPYGETVFYLAKSKLAIAPTVTATITNYNDARVIYTTGGILEEAPPPMLLGSFSVAKHRVWFFSAEQPELRFSDELFPTEVPQFNEVLSLPLPPGGGDGIIVKEIDGKIVAFQQYQISATFGDGPDATGQGGFPPLQIVARDIGSIIPNSVITTNDGIFFLSSKGLWLLNRGLQLEFIGTGIDDDAASIVCGAKLTDSEQIWFFTATKALIWDNYHKLWTTAPTGLTGITAAKVINGTLSVVANNSVYQLASVTTDNGTAITVRAKTGWISLGGLKGFERIRRIMFLTDQESATTMTVKLRYNFVDTVAETFTITSADIVDSGGNVQWLMRPKIQKCECFQIEFETSSSGATLELSSIALEYGIKSGLMRLPASKKIGGV